MTVGTNIIQPSTVVSDLGVVPESELSTKKHACQQGDVNVFLSTSTKRRCSPHTGHWTHVDTVTSASRYLHRLLAHYLVQFKLRTMMYYVHTQQCPVYLANHSHRHFVTVCPGRMSVQGGCLFRGCLFRGCLPREDVCPARKLAQEFVFTLISSDVCLEAEA